MVPGMTTKPILRAVPAPPEEDDKCSLCACRGRCVDKNWKPVTPLICFKGGESLYFKEVVREPIRN